MVLDYFNPETMKGKSSAAAGLCDWVVNICKYFRIYQFVEPKRKLLGEANAKLDAANEKLKIVRAQVAALEEKLAQLTHQFEEATAEKNEAIAAAEKTQNKANMADRLVNGLADEKIRCVYVYVCVVHALVCFDLVFLFTSAISSNPAFLAVALHLT